MAKVLVFVMAVLQLALVQALVDEWDDEWEPGNFRDSNFLRDEEHILEHYDEMKFMFDDNRIKDEEMEFHFFKAHDLNSDDKLDGLEILAALKHGSQRHLDRAMASHLTAAERRGRVDRILDRLSNQVDQILEEDDRNDDGYVSYVEYVAARRTADVLHKADDDSDDNS